MFSGATWPQKNNSFHRNIPIYVYYELLKMILRNPWERATMPSRMKMTSCHHLPNQEGVQGSSAPAVPTRSNQVKICFHKSNLPELPSLPGRACLTPPSWVMQKFLPGWATAECSCDLWLTSRSIFCEVLRLRGQPLSLSPLWQHLKPCA